MATKEKVEVPDFTNMPVYEVNSVAASIGLNISVKGASSTGDSIATQQSVPAGNKVSEGTVVTVTFAAQTAIAD